MILFAMKLQELPVTALIGSFLGMLAGLLVGSILNSIWLRLANSWLGFGELGFSKAFRTALMCTLVFGALEYVMLLSIIYGMLLEKSDASEIRINVLFFLSPMNFLYVAVGSVLGHGLIFKYRFPDHDGVPLPYGKACALALVYLGISAAFTLITWFLCMLALTTV